MGVVSIFHIKQPRSSQSSGTFVETPPTPRPWKCFWRFVLLILMHHVNLTYMATTGVSVSRPVHRITRDEERRNLRNCKTTTTTTTEVSTTAVQRRSHEHENLSRVRESSSRLGFLYYQRPSQETPRQRLVCTQQGNDGDRQNASQD